MGVQLGSTPSSPIRKEAGVCYVGLAGRCHHIGRTKQQGAEAMRKLSDIWLIGTQLARRLQVSKTGLYRAAESGELRTSSTACGRLATTLQEAERWLQRNRA